MRKILASLLVAFLPASVALADDAAPPAPAPVAAAPAPVVAAPAPVVAAPVAAQERVVATVIPRSDLDRELGDFAGLSAQVSLVANPRGGFRIVGVRSGSFASRIGLRAG